MKNDKGDDEEWNVFNIRMGIAAEAAVGYSINDEIAVTLGGKFAWHFLNTDEKTKKNISLFKDVFDGKYFQYGFDVFAGVTYSF